jgi:hypothetical protein
MTKFGSLQLDFNMSNFLVVDLTGTNQDLKQASRAGQHDTRQTDTRKPIQAQTDSISDIAFVPLGPRIMYNPTTLRRPTRKIRVPMDVHPLPVGSG